MADAELQHNPMKAFNEWQTVHNEPTYATGGSDNLNILWIFWNQFYPVSIYIHIETYHTSFLHSHQFI